MEYIYIIQNGGSKMTDALVPFLVITDVIMTSLLLLTIIYVLANVLVLSQTLLFKYFPLCPLWGKFGFCQQIQQYDVITTLDYVIVSSKRCSEVENNEYIIVCNFGGRRMSVFEAIEGDLRGSPPSQSQEAKSARAE